MLVHWRVTAPSIYGRWQDSKECPDDWAIWAFQTRARLGYGGVTVNNQHLGDDVALLGARFACAKVKDIGFQHTAGLTFLDFDLGDMNSPEGKSFESFYILLGSLGINSTQVFHTLTF